jgi:hypothetical protein
MRLNRALRGLAMCACAFAGCTAHSAPPPQHAAARAPACAESAPGSSRREMTWAEYYTDIRERSAHRGIMVIWLNPPDVHASKIDAEQPSACR